jgi:hypothetical protein
MAVVEQNGDSMKTQPVRTTRLQQEARIGWLFLAPWIIRDGCCACIGGSDCLQHVGCVGNPFFV